MPSTLRSDNLARVCLALTVLSTLGVSMRHGAHAQGTAQTVPATSTGPGVAASTNDPNVGTAAISGVITDAVTGRPVAGASVSIRRWQGASSFPRVLTDARGRFVFHHLPAADNYFLDAVRFGYSSTRYGWTGPDGPLTQAGVKMVPVTDGQWVNNIEIPLWRLGSITGRVTDERNEPVVGVAVRAFSVAKVAGQSQLVGGPIVVTDDRGMYRIANLMPSRYKVGVLSVQSTVLSTTQEGTQLRPVGELESGGIGGSSGSTVSAPGIDVDGKHRLVITNFATPPPPSSDQARAYPAYFYPSARNVNEAAVIDIGYSGSRNGVDIHLRPLPAVRVSGRVEGYSSTPPQMLLRLMPSGNERLGFGSEAATTLVEPDGSFTFLNVPDGTYTILGQASVMDFTTGSASNRFADAPGFPGGGIQVGSSDGAPGLGYLSRRGQTSGVWGRTAITVGNRDINDAVLQLHSTVTVRGRVAFAEGTTPSRGELLVEAEPASGDPTLGQHSAGTERDGTFRFSLPGLMGGAYLLSPFNDLGVVSVMWQGRDVTYTGLDASAGRDFEDVVLTLTSKTTEIRGYVTDPRVSPSALSAVIAFPVDRARWTNFGFEARGFRTARTGANGSYVLTRLPAGDYYVIAVDSSKIDAWVDPEFLATAAGLATKVTIDWGGKVSQDLTVREVVAK